MEGDAVEKDEKRNTAESGAKRDAAMIKTN